MPRRVAVVGLDDPPPSPTPPDGAAVARERVAQVVGTPRRPSAMGGDDDDARPSPRSSSDGSTRPLSGDGSAAVPLSAPLTSSTAPLTAGEATASLEVVAAPGGDGGRRCDPFSWREFAWMCGPGLLMAVAYLDPGNLEADIQVSVD